LIRGKIAGKVDPLKVESPILVAETAATASSVPARSGNRKPTLRIRPTKGWAALDVGELWRYRDLLWILVNRDIKLLYKQTALGFGWVALQPLIGANILALIFGRFAKLPSDGAPYLLFVFCGLTAWTYFSNSMQRASNSLIRNSQLVSKVYFPRMLIPLATMVAVLVDFAVMIVMLFVFMGIYGYPPSFRLLAIPGFLILMMLAATGVALWFSAVSVKYRDTSYALPFFAQIWMYASPVVYPTSMVASKVTAPWQTVYALNPAVGFIEGFRWAVLGHSALNLNMLLLTIGMSLFLLFSGAFFFRRVERGFADII
jgi:lipopolysaccharide transport system permease protein